MGIRERLSGNEAGAYAMKQINPDVMGAYPITPSTEIPQYFSTYVDNGEVDTLFIAVESEHSAMSTCIGAGAAGCRAISATSSCGLCYMTEMLYVAASDRLPITLAVSCRALSGPININNDHSDSMGIRDAGWIQLYAENNQEAYDNFLQAMPIGEDPAVRLPVMVCQDGFITSHALENIVLLDDASVKAFVGEYQPEHYLLKAANPLAVGAYDLSCHYMEHKVQQAEAMKAAKARIRCPLLDSNDQCVLYDYRPITCRLYGIPTAIGGKGHVCGQSNFAAGASYPTVHLDKIQERLDRLSVEIRDRVQSRFKELHEVFVPVSMALLTNYDDAYLGIGPAPKES